MRRAARLAVAALATILLAQAAPAQEQTARVASYNIRFLSTGVTSQGNRLEKLRDVVSMLDADVIGLQEIADRAALRLVFPAPDWQIVIDDESGDSQDVAVAVRKPFTVVGLTNTNNDLNAENQHFLFPNPADNSSFPNRRDVLFVEVRLPSPSTETFFVLVNHWKARSEGRHTTEPRRVSAARDLVRALQDRFDDRDYVVLGDFNDNPDDRSLNVLETGDSNAAGGAEGVDGPFLINLMEPLVAANHVSHGRTSGDVVGDRVNTVDPESRDRNNDARGTDVNTGDILFDQLLIPVGMRGKYVSGSAKVFDREVAVRGGNNNRASDHLPVFAEFVFGVEPEEPTPVSQVRITSLLPNPAGADAGREEVTLGNFTGSSVSLSGWKLRDASGNEFGLTGAVAAGARRTFVMASNSMPLTNSGDEVTLIDNTGTTRHLVSYTEVQAKSGQVVTSPDGAPKAAGEAGGHYPAPTPPRAAPERPASTVSAARR